MALGSSHLPPVPRPFRMTAWRPEWGSFWHQANEAAITKCIAEGRITTDPAWFTQLVTGILGTRGAG